jgi:hypothetical protein
VIRLPPQDHAADVVFDLKGGTGRNGNADVVALPDVLPRPKRGASPSSAHDMPAAKMMANTGASVFILTREKALSLIA